MTSLFTLPGYKQSTTEPPELTSYREPLDLPAFRQGLVEQQHERMITRHHHQEQTRAIAGFSDVVSRVRERGTHLQPFNTAIVRTLRYGDNKLAHLPLVRSFFFKGLEGKTTNDLIQAYCTFFDQQADDFGHLFHHVVEREQTLTDYSDDLVRRDHFYQDHKRALTTAFEGITPKVIPDVLPIAAQQTLQRRATREYDSLMQSMTVLDKLLDDTSAGLTEVDGLLDWCSGMKNILVLGKERMDNYGTHLHHTLITYLQAASLHRSLHDTHSTVQGLVDVMNTAQITADKGLEDLTMFVADKGIYSQPLRSGVLS